MICNRQTEHLCGDDGWQRLGQIGDHVHAPVRLDLGEQRSDDIADV